MRSSGVLGLALALAAFAACAGAEEDVSTGEPVDAGLVRDHDAIANEGEGMVIDAGAPIATTDYPLPVPTGFPRPLVPADNPLTTDKAELGRHLFYDVRLSGNGRQACSSCHLQERAFTDGKALAVGSTGQTHPRNSMTLVNVAYATTLTWPNPVLRTLEQQVTVPMFGIDPIVELGMRGHEDEILARMKAETAYPPLFGAAFPSAPDPFTIENVERALASFERTILSGSSRFDRFLYRGEVDALTDVEKRGYQLFGSETMECFHCHGGFGFTDSVSFAGAPGDPSFHNNGLYNIGGTGAYPPGNHGLVDFTTVPSDMGRFKVPTLRNVEKTAPYMHDGSIATLEEVIDHYSAGGRTVTSGPYAGVGSQNPYKSGFIVGFTITPDDKAAVVAFLRSLTDDDLLTDPKLANPWP